MNTPRIGGNNGDPTESRAAIVGILILVALVALTVFVSSCGYTAGVYSDELEEKEQWDQYEDEMESDSQGYDEFDSVPHEKGVVPPDETFQEPKLPEDFKGDGWKPPLEYYEEGVSQRQWFEELAELLGMPELVELYDEAVAQGISEDQLGEYLEEKLGPCWFQKRVAEITNNPEFYGDCLADESNEAELKANEERLEEERRLEQRRLEKEQEDLLEQFEREYYEGLPEWEPKYEGP